MVNGSRADQQIQIRDQQAAVPQLLAGASEVFHDRVGVGDDQESVEEGTRGGEPRHWVGGAERPLEELTVGNDADADVLIA